MTAIRVLLALALLLAACSTRGLNFRQDQRVTFSAPGDRALVGLPVTLDWDISDDLAEALRDTSAGPASFAVFVDVDPQPPGEDLGWFSREDATCVPTDGCPDADYLAERRIFVTTDTDLTLDRLPPAAGVDPRRGDRDLHDVTLVLLDVDGRRLGESAWTTAFQVAFEVEGDQ